MLAPGDARRPRLPGHLESNASPPPGRPCRCRYNGSVARVNFGPLSAARVRRWLRAGRFDLVHIHEPITPSISLLALWAAESPVVATFHTATPRSRSMQLAGGVLRPAIEKIDAGIAVSESARDVVVRHLGRDAVVIPNGIRCADFGAATPDGPTVPGPPADLPRPGRRTPQGSRRAAGRAPDHPPGRARSRDRGRRPGQPAAARRCRRRRHHHRRGEGRPARPPRTASSPPTRPGRASASWSSRRWPAGRRCWRPTSTPSPTCCAPARTGRMLGELFAEGDPAALAEAAIRMLNHPDPTAHGGGPPGRPALRLVAGRRAGSSRSTAPRWRPWNRPASRAPHHDHLVDHLGRW